MKQTVVQINGTMSISNDAGVARRIKRRDGMGRVDANLLSGTATVRAVGHQGHVMPPSPKPPAVKPVKEKIKPETPPTPPVVKPPEKKAKSRLRAARSHRGRWCAPTTSASRGSRPAKIGSAGSTTPASNRAAYGTNNL